MAVDTEMIRIAIFIVSIFPHIISSTEDCSVAGGNAFAEWSCWTEWSDCTVTCGGGERTRSGECKPGLIPSSTCDGDGNQREDCNANTCPLPTVSTTTPASATAEWNEWSAWTTCSVTCGGPGIRTRERQCIPDSSVDGAQSVFCPGAGHEVDNTCGSFACPSKKHCPNEFQYSIGEACYYLSTEEVTAYTAAAKCGMMSGSRLASVVTIEELTALTTDFPPNLNHWMGLYITDGQDYLVVSDGRRELSQSYFGTDLLSSSSTSCPDCTCIHIGSDGKLMQVDCTETRPFICEFKGGPSCPKGMVSLNGKCFGVAKNSYSNAPDDLNCNFESGLKNILTTAIIDNNKELVNNLAAYFDLNALQSFFIMTANSQSEAIDKIPNVAGSGSTFLGFAYESGAWSIKPFDTEENAYSLCEFYDRDIQCNFDNPFWEETACNWRHDTKFVESLGLEPGYLRLKRKLATNEHTNGNYWRFKEMKSDNYFVSSSNENGFFSLTSPEQIENGPRQFYPQFGFALRGKKVKIAVYFVELASLTMHEMYIEDRETRRLKQWDYFTFNLTEVPFLKDAWDSGTELKWKIVLHFEVKAEGQFSLDNIGPCSFEEIFFPPDANSGKMIGTCFRVQTEGNARYYDLDDICLGSSSQGSIRASFSRRDPEYRLLEAYIDFYHHASSQHYWAGHRDSAIGAYSDPEFYSDGTRFDTGDFRSAEWPHSHTRSRYEDHHYFETRRASEACPTQLTLQNTEIDNLGVSSQSSSNVKFGFSCKFEKIFLGCRYHQSTKIISNRIKSNANNHKDCMNTAKQQNYKYYGVQRCRDYAFPLPPCENPNPSKCPVYDGWSIYCFGGNSLNENSVNERTDVTECSGATNELGSCTHISLYELFDPPEESLFRFKGAVTRNEARAYCAYYGGPDTPLGVANELDMLNLINLIGREDIKSRQVPRYYGYWAHSWRLLAHRRGYPETTACETQHPFVCERPAAALEGPEFKAWQGCYSISTIPYDQDPNLISSIMTIEMCAHQCQVLEEKDFMGIEVTMCYCFDNLNGASPFTHSACNTKCPGDKAELCGGKGLMSVHKLVNETFGDVLVLVSGEDSSGNNLVSSDLILPGGTICTDHGIPDHPQGLSRAGWTTIGDYMIVSCGGYMGWDRTKDCYVLDLRQDTWTWDTSFVPALPTKMNRLCLEYNKKTHELWQFGGEIGYNTNTKDVNFWDFESSNWQSGPRMPEYLTFPDFSSAVYDKYIFVVDYEKLFWMNVEEKSSWLSKPFESRPYGYNRPAEYVGNFYGYPAILTVGGGNYGQAEEVWPTDGDIILLKDPSSPDGITIHQTNDFGIGTLRRGVIRRLNDEIVYAQGTPSTRQGSNDKDIHIWNYEGTKFEHKGEYSDARVNLNGVVVSGKYFRSCFEDNGFHENKVFEHKYADCERVFRKGKWLAPELQESFTTKLSSGSSVECKLENLHDNVQDCPKGFVGKGDDEFCLSVKTEAVDNTEAARQCYEDASDLLQVDSSDEDDYVMKVLQSLEKYTQPVNPGFYHTALYQRQEGRQYYLRNGARVRYQKSVHNPILTRTTETSCTAYAPLEAVGYDYKYFWKDLPCETKAPFICRHNPDLLGFHKLSNLVLEKTVDVKIPSMSMTTCLVLCQSTASPSQIAFILDDRCICSMGSPEYKIPVFKIKNKFTEKFVTAIDIDLPVQQRADSGDNTQFWKWNGHGLESMSVPGAVIELIQDSQGVYLMAMAPDKVEQRMRFTNGQLFNPKMNRYLGVNGNSILSQKDKPESMWILSQVDVDASLPLERLLPARKPLHGAWPFDCPKLLSCKDVPYQTCGCDLTTDYEETEKRGIVYFLGPTSKLVTKLDYQSCEELQFHSLEISGYFNIRGVNTYCSAWNADCGRGFRRVENLCLNISFAAAAESDIESKCAEIGAKSFLTQSSAVYMQTKAFLQEFGEGETFWSDFKGSGSTMADYVNGATPGQTTSELNMDDAWKDGASFGSPCTQMKPDSFYALEPAECSGEAKYICTKDVCPEGFSWYDKKSCAKVMDSTMAKSDALAQCKTDNPAATLLMPKSASEQRSMVQFLKNSAFTGEVFLGASRDDEFRWHWDDGYPIFVEGNDWTTYPTSSFPEAVDGKLNDLYWRTEKSQSSSFIEVELPEALLIPQVKIFTYSGSASTYFRNIRIRIGNDTGLSNTECEYKTGDGEEFEHVIFTCPAPGIVGKYITAEMYNGNNHFLATELSPYDCPNTFLHLNNKCYKFLEASTWFTQYQSCKYSRGVLLSLFDNPTNERIAKKILSEFAATDMFVGMQKQSNESKWRSDWYINSPTSFELPEDKVTTFINDNVLVATLENDAFTYKSSYGHIADTATYPAICEYIGDKQFTNWGVTSDVFEPLDDSSKQCMKTCYDETNSDCDGSWKVESCDTQLNFVCQNSYKCPEGWITFENSCYKLETSSNLKDLDQTRGFRHCKNTYNGILSVMNSIEEADYLSSYVYGVSQSIISPISGVPYLNLGTDLTLNTRYLEFQDGTIMTDGIMVDRENTSFTEVYGSGWTTDCIQIRGDTGKAARCSGGGVNLCEITLDADTHVCLNKETLDSSVTLNTSTELLVPTSLLSSGLCIEYCRGSSELHKYAIVGEDKCTCATEISFDPNQSPKNTYDSVKQLTNKCTWSDSKSMIGNDVNNVVAFYNTDVSLLSATAKVAPTHCRSYEHELFYTQYMDRFALQSEIKQPILRVDCEYKNSGLCAYPLLHKLSSSHFSNEGGTSFHRRESLAKKMFINNNNYVAELATFTDRTNIFDYLDTSVWPRQWRTHVWCDTSLDECLVKNTTESNGDFVTTDDIKIVIDLPNPSLLTGIWWSTATTPSYQYGFLRTIQNLEFNMAGKDYKLDSVKDVIKDRSNGRNNLEVTLFPQPILTQQLTLSGFQYNASDDSEWHHGHRIRFNLELFGCENYEIDALTCPDGWFKNQGLCLKAVESNETFAQASASSKCEEVGGELFSPMNDQYTLDLEDLISNTSIITESSFWIGISYSYNTLRKEKIFQFKNKLYIFDQHFNKWSDTHTDPDGECVKVKLNDAGKVVWDRNACSDTTSKGVICAQRNIWEFIPGCYAQPPEEVNTGAYSIIDDYNLDRDPVKYCRDTCKYTSRYFDIQNNATAHYCHCMDNQIPLGGFISERDCTVPECGDGESPETDGCHNKDGFRRTKLYKTWQTSCPDITVDLKDNFLYAWEHHGSWHWGSKATLRCIPGYELPQNLPNGEFDTVMRTQNVTCQFDDRNGGKWSRIIPCQPVMCKSPPPEQPQGGKLTVIKTLDPETNQQAETVLKYECSKVNWAFSYDYDVTLPSFYFTNNVNNMTITCNYSGYWEYDFGIEDSTCIGKQADGTCETISIPDCEDRTVYCQPLETPGNATREVLEQPNNQNELEYGTKIQLTCPQYAHYFDYSIPDGTPSFYYSTNINTTTLTCNEYTYWTVENGINGETCADKKTDDDELWCEYVDIPPCADRAILCSDPPMPARATIDFINRPDPNRFEFKTEIHYTCPDRNHYFDYEVPQDFVSFYYTENVNNINVTCTEDGVWLVNGGLEGLTCADLDPSTSNDTFICQDLNIPDCEDRTVYCSFPPDYILGGDVAVNPNPSPHYKKTDECRWTKWFNLGKGSKGDSESIEELHSVYSWQVCPNPKDIRARIVATKEIVTPNGPQVYAKYDTETGFLCQDDGQLVDNCYDYEVQLCCPYAPENGTVVELACNIQDWYLDFEDAAFIDQMTATCTNNSTWISDVQSQTFCKDGSSECALPRLPHCQDRTILCLDELPIPNDMNQRNISSNDTLHGYSYRAAYEYSCENDEYVIKMPNYPDAVEVRCIEPVGYPDDWYYGIWNRGVWEHLGNLTECIDPDKCYTPPPSLPTDYSVQYNLTLDSSNDVNVTLNYTCTKKYWVFDIPPIYNDCELAPEECEAIGAQKIHEFDRSVYAPSTIMVKCEQGKRDDGLPDWTWYAEDFEFHRPMPGCRDPTYCPDDPPIPKYANTDYDIPIRGSMKFEDGEEIIYKCQNSIYRFRQEGVHKDDWEDTLSVKCGWDNQWDPPEVEGCVDPRGCEPPPPRNDRVWGSYEDNLPDADLEVGAMYWYECRRGWFDFLNGSNAVQMIDLRCVNDPFGGPPYWLPPYDHDANPFPKCVPQRKYQIKYSFGDIEESIALKIQSHTDF